MFFIDTSIIYLIFYFICFSCCFCCWKTRARCFCSRDVSLCVATFAFVQRSRVTEAVAQCADTFCLWRRARLSARLRIRQIQHSQAGRQAGKPSKRASGSVRASRRAHCTHFGSIRTCSKPLRNIYVLATCRVIGWQHVAYCPAAYSVLPCPGIMLCVDLTEQHSQCCQGLATYSVLLRCITLATFVAQPLHLENFYDPVLRVGRQLLNTQL